MLFKRTVSEYIELYRKKGMSFSEIKYTLIQKGFLMSEIENAISFQKKIEDFRAYIIKNLDEGFSKKDIKNILIKAGWDEKIVDKTLKDISGTKKSVYIACIVVILTIIGIYLKIFGITFATISVVIANILIILTVFIILKRYLLLKKKVKKLTPKDEEEFLKKLNIEIKKEDQVKKTEEFNKPIETKKESISKKKKLIYVSVAIVLIGIINSIIFLIDDYSILYYIIAGFVSGSAIIGIIHLIRTKISKNNKNIPETETIDELKKHLEEKAERKATEEDIRKVLIIVDSLLEKLPENVIEEFTSSEDFKLYEKVLSQYNIK